MTSTPVSRIDPQRRTLLWISILSGAVYFVSLPWQPYPGSIIVKGLSVACLAIWSGKHGAALLTLALAASSLGDVLLDVRSVDLFVPGLCAFLAAHIVYAIRFVRLWERPIRVWADQRILLFAVIAYSLIFTAWLWSGLGPFQVPVACYILAITAMVCTSILARSPLPVILGAILFLASDSLIAVAKFKVDFPFRGYLVWGTYYLAQLGIAKGGLVQEEIPRNNRK